VIAWRNSFSFSTPYTAFNRILDFLDYRFFKSIASAIVNEPGFIKRPHFQLSIVFKKEEISLSMLSN